MIAAATAVSAPDVVLALLILAVVYAMCMVMQWDVNKTCEEQQRLDEIGADGSCPRGLTSDEPSRADTTAPLLFDWDVREQAQNQIWVASKSSPCVTPEGEAN